MSDFAEMQATLESLNATFDGLDAVRCGTPGCGGSVTRRGERVYCECCGSLVFPRA